MAERLGWGDRRVFLAVMATLVQAMFVPQEFLVGPCMYQNVSVSDIHFITREHEEWLLVTRRARQGRTGRDVVEHVGITRGQWEASRRDGVSCAPMAGQQ